MKPYDAVLWRICIHEAGHSVVGNVLGTGAHSPEIFFDGQFFHGRVRRYTEGQNRAVSLSGEIAELMLIDFPAEHYGIDDAEQSAANVRKMFPNGRYSKRQGLTEYVGVVMDRLIDGLNGMSDADRSGSDNFSIRDVKKAVRLIMKHEAEIRFEADYARKKFLSEPTVRRALKRLESGGKA